jgi:ribonuclease BN (tRNA processing enzyme)
MIHGMERFVIRGTRGTLPACGADFLKYGGSTTCFSLETDEGLIIIDAGTGLTHLGRELTVRQSLPPITMIFTHLHMDHLLGLPCFAPLYQSDASITLMADPRRPGSWQIDLRTFIGVPYFPVGLADVDASMQLRNLPIEAGAMDLYGVKVRWFGVPHPQGCLAFRLEAPSMTIVIATDAEYLPDTLDPAFVEFCRGADVLFFDTQYTASEYESHRGWGHSTWDAGVALASAAQPGTMILGHHQPQRTDEEIDALLHQAQQLHPGIRAGSDNLVVCGQDA